MEQTGIEMDKLEQAGAAGEKKKRQEEQARLVDEQRKAKAARLHQVMNTPNEEGDTMRTKILRAAKNAQKLGVGDYATGQLKPQGLTPLHARSHTAPIDPNNPHCPHLPTH